LTHHASKKFWKLFETLPESVQGLARKNFDLLKSDPVHPSLHFKKVSHMYSVRVGLKYRALGVESPDGVLWFWIGSHADYDKML
jgi:hypothetical protein